MSASIYWFWWKISKIYHAIVKTTDSLEERHHELVTHLCPLRGQRVWDITVCGLCFFLAAMEPQDMVSWCKTTNNLPDFINNCILQRDNVSIDENPLKPGSGRSSKLAHKCACSFLHQLDLLYFTSITAFSKGNMLMNIWTMKQILWLCWYANAGQICQENKKVMMNIYHLSKTMHTAEVWSEVSLV